MESNNRLVGTWVLDCGGRAALGKCKTFWADPLLDRLFFVDRSVRANALYTEFMETLFYLDDYKNHLEEVKTFLAPLVAEHGAMYVFCHEQSGTLAVNNCQDEADGWELVLRIGPKGHFGTAMKGAQAYGSK